MKRTIARYTAIVISHVVLAVALAVMATPASAAERKIVRGTVTAVTDGDTLKVLTEDGKLITVRLEGIDAPESSQSFGPEAKVRLASYCLYQDVNIGIASTDRYGRYVGDVSIWVCTQNTVDQSLLFDVCVNRQMVADGMAWHYVSYPGAKYLKADLAAAEIHARAFSLGLWKDKKPTPPWEYRKARKAK